MTERSTNIMTFFNMIIMRLTKRLLLALLKVSEILCYAKNPNGLLML